YYYERREKSQQGEWQQVGPARTLILHWDGNSNSWQVVPAPDVAGVNNQLRAITAVSRDDIWAVGSYGGGYGWDNPTAPKFNTLVLHWDGKTWSQVPSPNPSDYGNQLVAVSAASKDDIWAVGTSLDESKPIGGVNG